MWGPVPSAPDGWSIGGWPLRRRKKAGAEYFKIDFTVMHATHDALRRDLEHIATITARLSDDPCRVLGTAAGWEMFKAHLRAHNVAEDRLLWPLMRRALAGRPDELALLEEMEAEHATVDPLLYAIDAVLADREGGLERLAGLTDALFTGLSEHLGREESEALALIDATLTQEEYAPFDEAHRQAPARSVPWLLDGAGKQTSARILAALPEQVRRAYAEEWRDAYARLDRWSGGSVRRLE
ncbi:hemerythrin domain-containing protein [Nonomuraea sp. NPDC050536]|uniref:hemerythrin domain-containing protein n=1 Tax=Nonomuraea sp. NPDC050536 TaxID=3364366 RepID=UPI0037C590A5